MRLLSISGRTGYPGTLCGAAWMTAVCFAQTGASGGEPPDAKLILMQMADFLSKSPRLTVTVHSAYDAVQPEGDKVEWNDLRRVTLTRPDRLAVEVPVRELGPEHKDVD